MAVVRHYREESPVEAGEGVTMRIVIGPNQRAPFFNMRVFEVEPGGSTPHHSHWWEHEVFVLSGEGFVRTVQGEKKISAGYTVFIPGGERHQFVNTGNEFLRFICVVPQKWMEQIDPATPL